MFPSGGEIILILLFVLILFGSKDLPRIVRTAGKWYGTMRRSVSEIQMEFNRISIAEERKAHEEKVLANKINQEKIVQPAANTQPAEAVSSKPVDPLTKPSEAATGSGSSSEQNKQDT